MSLLRYDPRALRGDGACAVAGLGLSAAPLLLPALDGPVRVLFVAGTVLFAAFLLRTLAKAALAVELAEEGVRVVAAPPGPLSLFAPSSASVRWQDLCMVRLRFFSTRRDQGGGWMELTLEGAEGRLRLDSTLRGFRRIAEESARAAARRGLELPPATLANYRTLGIPAPGEAEGR